ncbi:hypothetical protein SAMN06265375_1192 [Muriicola jejuensis]|uniref:Uncharacterized protein n=1 Tax=Muriicola jejuensis TaxID=504488 RepID=A0A6P0UET6_9FLAO|nr:hypothetical protein [Muriicola jejuensis]NER11791.1 hypothetical protein [Muriicola jejuensis]SMP28019.1 hypothetical protein SAMN06265375_1192 [Muriicola jejuensis]
MSTPIKKDVEEFIKRISNKQKWPKIDTFLIVSLMRIAGKAYDAGTVDGRVSAVIIYHQIVEEFLVHLLKLSNLYIQAKIWPSRLDLEISNKLMFGQILKEHKRSIKFNGKDVLLLKCERFNTTRIEYVHRLLKFKSDEERVTRSAEINNDYYEIIDLYLEGRKDIEDRLNDLSHHIDWNEIEKNI